VALGKESIHNVKKGRKTRAEKQTKERWGWRETGSRVSKGGTKAKKSYVPVKGTETGENTLLEAFKEKEGKGKEKESQSVVCWGDLDPRSQMKGRPRPRKKKQTGQIQTGFFHEGRTKKVRKKGKKITVENQLRKKGTTE